MCTLLGLATAPAATRALCWCWPGSQEGGGSSLPQTVAAFHPGMGMTPKTLAQCSCSCAHQSLNVRAGVAGCLFILDPCHPKATHCSQHLAFLVSLELPPYGLWDSCCLQKHCTFSTFSFLLFIHLLFYYFITFSFLRNMQYAVCCAHFLSTTHFYPRVLSPPLGYLKRCRRCLFRPCGPGWHGGSGGGRGVHRGPRHVVHHHRAPPNQLS